MKIIKDDLKFLLFSEIYLKFDEPKGKRKALTILEAAIQCLARKGFDQITAEMIAREAGISRSLVGHYFKNVEEVQTYALKYIRVLYQKLVVDAFSAKDTPKEMLLAHVHACLAWTQTMRGHALVWISFLHRCGRDTKQRRFNTEAVGVGTDRIEALIKLGVEQDVFVSQDIRKTARAIQVLITGAVISMCSEDFEDESNFIYFIQNACLSLAVPK